MARVESKVERSLGQSLQERVGPIAEKSSWVLRITEHKDRPAPVFIVKERVSPEPERGLTGGASYKGLLKERGLLYGQHLRRCLPVIRNILSAVCDHEGIPLELQHILSNGRINFRGNLPLDEEAGAKLSLICKLREGIADMERVELLAWRVQRFSREEALYWLSRASQYGEVANRWALAGMRLMLGGQPGDPAIPEMLERLRL